MILFFSFFFVLFRSFSFFFVLFRSFSLSNRDYLNQLHPEIKNLCTKSISNHEILTYLNSYLSIIGYYTTDITHNLLMFTVAIKLSKQNLLSVFGCNLDVPDFKTESLFDHSEEIDFNLFLQDAVNTYLSYFDYITSYRILRNRLICIRIDPSFAKRFIIDLIKSNLISNDTNDKAFTTNAFIIILLNSIIFNIYPSPNYNLL